MRVTCGRCSKEWGGIRAAHCSGCHKTFVSPNAFDLHQSLKHFGAYCLQPATVGLVYDQDKDLYRYMSPEEERDSVVCDPCKDGRHCDAKGCTCQHRPPAQTLSAEGIESGEAVGNLGN